MAEPVRNAKPENILSSSRTFFATTRTWMGRRTLQSERNSGLLFEVLRANMKAGRFKLHDFVIMPDHIHLLLTLEGTMTIEKAMQLIKGGFSYRLGKEHGVKTEVWQKGFSEVRVDDEESFMRHKTYIAANPVKAGLAGSADEYPYCFAYLASRKATGAKAPESK
jgi:putative transposase